MNKHAAAYLDLLRSSLDAGEKKALPNGAPGMNASPPDSTPASTGKMPLETPTTRLQAISSATNTDTAAIAPRAVTALWGRFTHLYGHRWETSYGPALTEAGALTPIAATWAKALAGFGPDDLARGLHACLDRNDGWPPTLPEFRALCQAPRPLAPCHVLMPRACERLESDEIKAARKAAARVGVEQLRALVGLPRVSR